MVTNIKIARTIPKSFELIGKILYYFIAVVLLFSGISKIIDPTPMMETMKAVFKVNESLLILAATILPIIEIGFGLMLVFNVQTKKILIAVSILFFHFFVFSVYGSIIGLNNDCGCFGNLVKSEFGIFMILRNLVFFIISILAIKSFNVTAEALINKSIIKKRRTQMKKVFFFLTAIITIFLSLLSNFEVKGNIVDPRKGLTYCVMNGSTYIACLDGSNDYNCGGVRDCGVN